MLTGQAEAEPAPRETAEAVAEAPEPTVDDLVKELAKVTAVAAPPAEAAPVLEMAGEASAPERGFIPPPPVSPGPKSTLGNTAEPFASAAMSNGAPPMKKVLSRGLSLFERMTGSGKARKDPPPAPPAVNTEPLLRAAAAKPESAPSEGAKPDVGLTLPKIEEDVLDIPAFLRRQTS